MLWFNVYDLSYKFSIFSLESEHLHEFLFVHSVFHHIPNFSLVKFYKLAFFCSNNQTRFYNPRWQTLTVKARALGTTRDILRKHSCFEKCLPFFLLFCWRACFFHLSHGLSVFLKIWKWRASYYFRSRSSLKEKVISTSTVLYICRNISWQHQVYLILLWRSSFRTPPVNESSLYL